MSRIGQQSIYCDVAECRHNTGGDYCKLNAIHVANDAGVSDSVRTQHESMCGSFRRG